MLAILTSTPEEADRQSAILRRRKVDHVLVGPQGDYFKHARDPRRVNGRHYTKRFLTEDGIANDELTQLLRDLEVTQVANAGTLNGLLNTQLSADRYAGIGRHREKTQDRFEGLCLEANLHKAGIETRALNDVSAGGRPPAPSRRDPERLDEAEIAVAVAKGQAAIAACVAAHARKDSWYSSVALTSLYEEGVCGEVDWHTDDLLRPAILAERQRQARRSSRSRRMRLLLKLTQPGQSALDPSAIGPTTIELAKQAGLDAIVLSRDGYVFKRNETIELARTMKMPIIRV